MISLRAVEKSYRLRGKTRRVFTGLDLDIPAGHCTGIIGTKKSGKTTLLKLLCGLERPDRGRIDVDGRVSVPLGMNLGQTARLTARENTSFFARVLGLPVGRTIKAVEDLAGLGAKFDQPIAGYREPLKTRLNFAASLVAGFDWYLADGLVAVSEKRHQERFLAQFEALKRRGNVIIAASGPKLLRAHCDRLIVLHDGTATYYTDLEQGLAAYRGTDSSIKDRRKARKRRLNRDQPVDTEPSAGSAPSADPRQNDKLPTNRNTSTP